MLLIMYSWGWFTHNAMLKDIVALKSFHVIASSENWELLGPSDFGYTPFFRYKGKGKVENTVDICGVIDRKKYIYNGEIILDGVDGIDRSAVMDRHFFIGEKRWYTDDSHKIYHAACLEITWKKNDKIYSEVMSSEELTKEQIEEIKNKWIDQSTEEREYLYEIFGEPERIPVNQE
ncbi:MAG: hypothetical protein VB095_03580 [Anaerovorax sp.]|nr:hypothetical protein [Anaerovorax sp.]